MHVQVLWVWPSSWSSSSRSAYLGHIPEEQKSSGTRWGGATHTHAGLPSFRRATKGLVSVLSCLRGTGQKRLKCLPLVSPPSPTMDTPWLPRSRHNGTFPQLRFCSWEIHAKFWPRISWISQTSATHIQPPPSCHFVKPDVLVYTYYFL